MKRFLAISLACLSVTAAYAAPGSLASLNSEVKSILTGFQSSRTRAAMNFNELRTNGKQALALSMNAIYSKVGAKNEFTVTLKDLSYKYGAKAVTTGNGAVKVDLTKLMGQEELNQLMPSLNMWINGIAATFAAKYGQAGNLKANVSDLKKDEQGNYVSLKADISFQLDYAKLPANVAKDEVMFDSGKLALTLSTTQGLGFNFEMVSNKEYKGFNENEKGLKEYIDTLLAKDARTLDEIKSMFRNLDQGAEGIVEGKML